MPTNCASFFHLRKHFIQRGDGFFGAESDVSIFVIHEHVQNWEHLRFVRNYTAHGGHYLELFGHIETDIGDLKERQATSGEQNGEA
jgi:hypothetical protein